MLLVNVGTTGATVKGIAFDTGKYVEVEEALAQELINKYTAKFAIHIIKAPDAMEHADLLKTDEEGNKRLEEKLEKLDIELGIDSEVKEEIKEEVKPSKPAKQKRKYTKKKK